MHIFLDIDKTLIDTINVPDPKNHSLYPKPDYVYKGIFLVYKRPYLREFLEFVFENFETVSIWTNATLEWLYTVVDEIITPLFESDEEDDSSSSVDDDNEKTISKGVTRYNEYGFYLNFSRENSFRKKYVMNQNDSKDPNKPKPNLVVELDYKDLRPLFNPLKIEKYYRSVHPEMSEFLQNLRMMMEKKNIEYFSKRNTLIVDDQATNYEFTPNNGIRIPPYNYDVDDSYLVHLVQYLMNVIHSKEDVDRLDHRKWFNRKDFEIKFK